MATTTTVKKAPAVKKTSTTSSSTITKKAPVKRATKATKVVQEEVQEVQEEIIPSQPESLMDQFVFMDKAKLLLDVGIKTNKNIVLYGPGGHGKSELTLEFFYEKDIVPYVFVMGKGTTTDRLFGGLNIPVMQETGKIEYLIENSFMNHEYVIFEEMMDANDYILEQLKDILSSGQFRNGSQVYEIKTKFIVCCTNRTRAEFSKNDSLRALMERFPLELNVVWDNYTEAAYKTLLEKRYGVDQVDPFIPFLLQEYHSNKVTVSPRIALDAYHIFQECGPTALPFIAEFTKKPELISSALSKFEANINFKKIASEIAEVITRISNNPTRTTDQQDEFVTDYKLLSSKFEAAKKITVNDDLVQISVKMQNHTTSEINRFREKFELISERQSSLRLAEMKAKKMGGNSSKSPF